MEKWMIILIIIGLLYIITIPICVAVIAAKRGRNGFGWFLLSFLINPLFAILVLIALGDTDEKLIEKAMKEERARESVRFTVNSNVQNFNNTNQTPDYSRFMPH